LRVIFKSFGPIRRLLGTQVIELEVSEGSSVFQVVETIVDMGGQPLRNLVFDNGEISGNLIVILNKKDISTIGGVDIPVNEGDEITVLPHVQGG